MGKAKHCFQPLWLCSMRAIMTISTAMNRGSISDE